MELTIKKDYDEVCSFVAGCVAEHIAAVPGTLVCLAAGDTMLGVFQKLVELQKQGKVELASADYVSLDEWGGLGYEDAGSCRQVLYDNFYIPAGIPEKRICFFDGKNRDIRAECSRVAAYIEQHGQIGISVLGIGMNGHVGFNEPYTKQESACMTVMLDPITRQVSAKYFGSTVQTDFGITLSISTLLESRRILLVANGEKKVNIVCKTLGDMSSMAVPSTMMRTHANCTLVVDKAACPV